jgi:hypothetical protein
MMSAKVGCSESNLIFRIGKTANLDFHDNALILDSPLDDASVHVRLSISPRSQ